MKPGLVRIVYAALSLGILVSALSLYGVVSGLQRAAVQARAEFRDDIVWYATQYRAELNVLVTALQGYLLDSDDYAPAEIVDRFDVFWSRLQSAGSGPLGRKLAQLENARATVDEALATLRFFEPVVLALDQAEKQEIHELIGQLSSLRPRFQALALAAAGTKVLDQESLYRQQSESSIRIVAFMAGILVLGASLLMLLRIEKAKVDSLSRDLEQRLGELEAAQHGRLQAERLATIGQLTATVSHELRNPLATIYSSCIMLHRRLADSQPDVDKTLARIERSIDRCNRIIEELLSYTRTRELNLEQVSVDPWIRTVVKEIDIPETVAVTFELRSGVSTRLDKERMRQVLVNLIDNAWQSMMEPGDATRAPRITVASRTADDRLLIHIADTGPGIPAEAQETIFEPLYSTRSFGVGLGLPLVRQIVEDHGGVIELQASTDAGATFTISLPLCDRQTNRDDCSPPVRASGFPS